MKNHLFICTTGISLITNVPKIGTKKGSLTNPPQDDEPWDAEAGKFEKEFNDCLCGIDYKKDAKTRRKLSAEINSLDLFGVNPDDIVVLLASDTLKSHICAKGLRQILTNSYGLKESNVKIQPVEGLQVKNTETLRKKGLNNLVSETVKFITGSEYASYDVILNPTGGFKCGVPFLVVLGMLYRLPSIYVYEGSEKLLRLPPLPLAIDFELFGRMTKALEYAEQNDFVTESEFLSKIDGYTPSERDLFMSFTEKFDEKSDLINLSPLAYSLMRIEKDSAGKPVKITQEALDKLHSIYGNSRVELERILERSSSWLWRREHTHKKYGNKPNADLVALKPGHHTAERVVGYLDNNIFHVVLVYDSHTEYDKGYDKNYTRSDFANDKFVDWVREKTD